MKAFLLVVGTVATAIITYWLQDSWARTIARQEIAATNESDVLMRSVDSRAVAYHPRRGDLWATFVLATPDGGWSRPDLSIPSLPDGGFDSVCFPDDGGRRCVPMAELAHRCR